LERSRKGAEDARLDLGERRMKTGKRSATPMTIQPYRGVDQQPMSITPSKLSTKAERSVAAPLKKTAAQFREEPASAASIEVTVGSTLTAK
jgi:hypothetical protein